MPEDRERIISEIGTDKELLDGTVHSVVAASVLEQVLKKGVVEDGGRRILSRAENRERRSLVSCLMFFDVTPITKEMRIVITADWRAFFLRIGHIVVLPFLRSKISRAENQKKNNTFHWYLLLFSLRCTVFLSLLSLLSHYFLY